MEQKYIYICEDGTVLKGGPPTGADMVDCEGGILQIINTETMTEYYEGEWNPIVPYDEGQQ